VVYRKGEFAKKRLHRVFAPLLKFYSDVSSLVRVALTAEMRI
jgi:hypothetical protein